MCGFEAQCADHIALPFCQQSNLGARIMAAGKPHQCLATDFKIVVIQSIEQRFPEFWCVGISLRSESKNSPTAHFEINI